MILSRSCTRVRLVSLFTFLLVSCGISTHADEQAVPKFTGVPFTKKGYDVDNGTAPICWTVPLDRKGDDVHTYDFLMMPECFKGTNMTVKPLGMTKVHDSLVMYTGELYTFEVEVNVNYQQIFEDVANDRFGGTGNYSIPLDQSIKFDILLCDTRKIGFCNPIVTIFTGLDILSDTPPVSNNSSSYPDNSSDDDHVLLGGNDTINTNETVGGYTTGNPQKIFNQNQTTAYSFTDEDALTSTYRETKAVLFGSYLLTEAESFGMRLLNETTLAYNFKANVSFSIPTELNIRGPFFVTGNAQALLCMTGNYPDVHPHDPAQYVIIADAIPENILEIRPRPQIDGVSNGMRIGTICAGTAFSVFCLLALIYVVWHREHPVMKLAQWPFLVWLLLCAVVTNVFLFTFMPTEDWHCQVYSFLQLTPLTMIAAILVGRSWRCYMTLSYAMAIGKENSQDNSCTSKAQEVFITSLTYAARVPSYLAKLGRKTDSSANTPVGGFRQNASALQTTTLILWMSLPQFVVQVVGMIVTDRTVIDLLSPTDDFGRKICSNGELFTRVGYSLMWAVLVVAVALAWCCKNLPSAFNETSSIFQAASINGVVSLMAISLDGLANSPGTSPDVTTFVWAATSAVSSLTCVWYIVIPKILRVQSGEKVVISNLLAQTRDSRGKNGGWDTSHPGGSKESIHLKKHDPIPRALERDMFEVSNLLLQMRDEKFVQGRTPELEEWQRLIGSVDQLNGDLGRISFDWTNEGT